ncbi:unnamed protein product [Amoebophrya sp. A25]|nr:unnamed protein product [Amoebophrya sp. A25]|eukprot:GSA25T00005101001.1
MSSPTSTLMKSPAGCAGAFSTILPFQLSSSAANVGLISDASDKNTSSKLLGVPSSSSPWQLGDAGQNRLLLSPNSFIAKSADELLQHAVDDNVPESVMRALGWKPIPNPFQHKTTKEHFDRQLAEEMRHFEELARKTVAEKKRRENALYTDQWKVGKNANFSTPPDKRTRKVGEETPQTGTTATDTPDEKAPSSSSPHHSSPKLTPQAIKAKFDAVDEEEEQDNAADFDDVQTLVEAGGAPAPRQTVLAANLDTIQELDEDEEEGVEVESSFFGPSWWQPAEADPRIERSRYSRKQTVFLKPYDLENSRLLQRKMRRDERTKKKKAAAKKTEKAHPSWLGGLLGFESIPEDEEVQYDETGPDSQGGTRPSINEEEPVIATEGTTAGDETGGGFVVRKSRLLGNAGTFAADLDDSSANDPSANLISKNAAGAARPRGDSLASSVAVRHRPFEAQSVRSFRPSRGLGRTNTRSSLFSDGLTLPSGSDDEDDDIESVYTMAN